jgi:hypothetical protein
MIDKLSLNSHTRARPSRAHRSHAAAGLVLVERLITEFATPLTEFFVQPVTAAAAPPNLPAHKPAGNCAPRDDDRAQMPGRCLRGALAQSKGEADDYHRGLCFNRPASCTGRTERLGAIRKPSRWQPRR